MIMDRIEIGKKSALIDISNFGIKAEKIHWNLSNEELTNQSLALDQGRLNNLGALCVNTGKFTGRSPKDKFIVKDKQTTDTIDWGEVNIPIAADIFDNLYHKMTSFLANKDIWVRNCYAGADPAYRLNVTVINTTPWANLFCNNLFITPTDDAISNFENEWLILQIPEFESNPSIDGTRSPNFTIVNFTKKIILIGGSAYTGEMKKGIFSVLNFILPHQYGILPMHCSANEGKDADVSLFFGLSGTGKTTLSADANRSLIGDDEHGWAERSVFNFEGGCYAKVVDLSQEKEPEIYGAIKPGALLENVSFFENSNIVDFTNTILTENTRVAYPIDYIPNAKQPSLGAIP